MNDTAVIFILLALGFALFIIVIRFYPFKVFSTANNTSLYYKLNLTERKSQQSPSRL